MDAYFPWSKNHLEGALDPKGFWPFADTIGGLVGEQGGPKSLSAVRFFWGSLWYSNENEICKTLGIN